MDALVTIGMLESSAMWLRRLNQFLQLGRESISVQVTRTAAALKELIVETGHGLSHQF
jgi:hypothetical protein